MPFRPGYPPDISVNLLIASYTAFWQLLVILLFPVVCDPESRIAKEKKCQVNSSLETKRIYNYTTTHVIFFARKKKTIAFARDGLFGFDCDVISSYAFRPGEFRRKSLYCSCLWLRCRISTLVLVLSAVEVFASD